MIGGGGVGKLIAQDKGLKMMKQSYKKVDTTANSGLNESGISTQLRDLSRRANNNEYA